MLPPRRHDTQAGALRNRLSGGPRRPTLRALASPGGRGIRTALPTASRVAAAAGLLRTRVPGPPRRPAGPLRSSIGPRRVGSGTRAPPANPARAGAGALTAWADSLRVRGASSGGRSGAADPDAVARRAGGACPPTRSAGRSEA